MMKESKSCCKHIKGICCNVKSCRYNDENSCCTAEQISVGPSSASTSSETACATFIPRETV